jgi:long-chain acyl-CoA synthetase
VEGKNYKFIGIYAKNRVDWAVVNLASMRNNTTIVPFFDSLGTDALVYVINQTEVTTMCIEGKNIDLLIKLKTEKSKSLENIVSFDEFPEEKKAKAKEAGLNLYHISEVVEIGK